MQRLDTFQEAGSERLEIGPGMGLSQTFVSQKPNLSSLRLPVYNPNLGGDAAYAIRLWQGSHLLRDLPLRESNLGWADVLRFDFAPIAESEGQEYRVEFVSLEASKSGDRTHVALAVSDTDNIPGSLEYNQTPQVGDLRFASYYQLSLGQWPVHAMQDLVQRLWQRPGFVVLYLVVIVGLIAGVIRLRNKHIVGRIRP